MVYSLGFPFNWATLTASLDMYDTLRLRHSTSAPKLYAGRSSA